MVICSVLNFRPGSVNIEPDQTVNSDVMQELFVSIIFCTIKLHLELMIGIFHCKPLFFSSDKVSQ